MVKISNIELKVANIICISIFTLVMFPCIILLFVFGKWEFGLIMLFVGIVTEINVLSITTFFGHWPETIVIDNKEIIVYRFRKEINKISWQNVKEIYKEDIKTTNRFNRFYYFSDGQESFLNDKNGNEHFIKFRCSKEKEYLFSKFTDLPIQDLNAK